MKRRFHAATACDDMRKDSCEPAAVCLLNVQIIKLFEIALCYTIERPENWFAAIILYYIIIP